LAPWRYEPAPGGRTWGRVVAADGAKVAAAVGDGRTIAAGPELVKALLELAEFAEHDGGFPRYSDSPGEKRLHIEDEQHGQYAATPSNALLWSLMSSHTTRRD
jgi:hypothetical protein